MPAALRSMTVWQSLALTELYEGRSEHQCHGDRTVTVAKNRHGKSVVECQHRGQKGKFHKSRIILHATFDFINASWATMCCEAQGKLDLSVHLTTLNAFLLRFRSDDAAKSTSVAQGLHGFDRGDH